MVARRRFGVAKKSKPDPAIYAEDAKYPRVMALAAHPSSVPHRIKDLETVYDYLKGKAGVWFTTAEEIYEWYESQT